MNNDLIPLSDYYVIADLFEESLISKEDLFKWIKLKVEDFWKNTYKNCSKYEVGTFKKFYIPLIKQIYPSIRNYTHNLYNPILDNLKNLCSEIELLEDEIINFLNKEIEKIKSFLLIWKDKEDIFCFLKNGLEYFECFYDRITPFFIKKCNLKQ
jgi:hypothetical protein